MEKIKKAKCISIVLLFVMVFQMIMPVSFAYGDEMQVHNEDLSEGGSNLLSGTTTSSAITADIKIEFKDNKGNVIDHKVNKVPFDASVSLDIRLDIADMEAPNDSEDKNYIDISQNYLIKIADQINISTNKSIQIYHPVDKAVQIATADINTNGTIIITFLDAINDYDTGRYVQIEADGKMDASEIGGGGEQKLEFQFDGKFEYVDVKFDEKVEKVILEKTGNWDKGKNEITWTITVKAETNPKGLTIKNVVIKDTIGAGQTWQSETEGDAVYNSVNKTFTFAELKDGETKTIKVVTKPDLSAFTPEKEDKEVTLENTVGATYGIDGLIKDKTVNVKNTVNFINKTGLFIPGNTRGEDVIKWTIDINNNNLNMPAGTTLEDVIPTGLKLIAGSVKIDGKLVNNFTGAVLSDVNEKGFKITFNNGLTKKITVIYETEITDPNAYEPDNDVKYLNNAKLTWNDSGEKSIPGTAEVGIGRTVIQKSGNGYEANDNRYVKWKITINSDKLDIKNPVVTDTLPKELEYVSHTVSPTTEVWVKTTTGTAVGVEQVITFSHVGKIDKTYTIDLITRVKDGYKDIYGANKETTFVNKVSLKGDNVEPKNTTANQRYYSTVIAKSNTGYDHIDRKASWEIVVNQNKMTINNAIITDTIGNFHEFVDGSLKLGVVKLTQVQGDPAVGQYSVVNKVVTINLGKINNTTETITYETLIPEEVLDDIFNENTTPKLTNSATLTGTEIKNGGETVTSEKAIKNTVISKKANYTNKNDFIEWLVEINLNQLDFKDADVTLEDTLQEMLILDKNSVKLYKLTMKSDGTYVPVTESDIVKDKVTVNYDTNTNKVDFKLGKVNKAYLLKFTTDINLEKLNGTISNTISLKGHNKIGDNATGTISVNFNNVDGEGGGSKTRGSIKIVKKDDYNNLIEGIEFELYDNLKKPFNPPKRSTTNDEGIAYFEDLPMGNYWIKEIVAPGGFIKLNEEISVKLSKGLPTPELDPKNPVLTIINERIVIDKIEIKKVDGIGEALKGAKFDLYKKGSDVSIASAVSGEDGLVTFDNINKGEYLIKETEAPEGYLKSSRVIYVKAEKISDDTSQLNISYSYDDNDYTVMNPEFANDSINIELQKTTKSNDVLEGAEFTLYDEDGNVIEGFEPVTSNAFGEVIFTAVPTGRYIIKETKAPSGYMDYNKEIHVEVSVNDNNEAVIVFTIDGELVELNEDGVMTVENERKPTTPTPNPGPVYGKIAIKKTDENKKVLSGAEFTLYNDKGAVVEKAVTGADGIVKFEELAKGNYTIEETKAPTGYVLSDKVINVVISGSNTETFTFVNKKEEVVVKPNTGKVEIIKTDENGKTLSDAWFDLRDEKGVSLQNVKTDSNGRALFENVAFGKYTIVELQAPQGYQLSTQRVTVTVDKEEVVSFTFVNKPIDPTTGITTLTGNILINKIDSNSKPLAGAEFALYNENNVVIKRVISDINGKVLFDNLPLGKYMVQEISAPDGYELDSDELIVDLKNAKTYSYNFVNLLFEEIDDPNVPKGWEYIEDTDVPTGTGVLPNTGSIFGTFMLILIGALLMLTGFGMLFNKRFIG